MQTEKELKLKQEIFIENILQDYNMMESKVSTVPIESSKTRESAKNTIFPYRELLACLKYISNKTRPDKMVKL